MLAAYREVGHVTVSGVFAPADQRRWYVDAGVKAREVLRKLDNPHHHRASVGALAFLRIT